MSTAIRPARPTSAAQATGVVVGVDDSASARSAVMWAAAVAGRRGVDLHLVEVLPGSADLPGRDDSADGTRPGAPHGRARALLSRAHRIAQATHPGLTVSMHTLSGRVGPALVSYADQASLLVVGANGPGGPIPLSLGSVLGGLTRCCPSPVVLVPVPSRTRASAGQGPVFVALEDTPDGERAVAFAADVAERRGVSLIPLVSARDATPAAPDDRSAPAGGQVDRVRDRHPALTIDPQTVSAPLADALLAAGDHASLIVVPSRGRRPRRDRPTAGWTGHFLPILSTCPVAVVSTHTRPSAIL